MTRSIASASQLKGVFPALFTPLLPDDPKRLRNTIDYEKAKSIIDDLIAAGVDGLVPVGTTGQSATLSPDQHVDFIRFAVEYAGARVPIIAGAGSNCTRESVETIIRIRKLTDQEVFLCVTGYYNNPTQDGLVRHYRTLVEETGARIVIYNVPGRTNSYLEPETLIELARDAGIIGLKQAVDFRAPGKLREDTRLLRERTSPADFAMLSGEDDCVAAMLQLGGQGVISATANIPEAARLFGELVKASNEGDVAGAAVRQQQLAPFIEACFIRKNPIPLGTLFNSPLYQPLSSVRDSPRGEAAHRQLMAFIATHAPSLDKYTHAASL